MVIDELRSEGFCEEAAGMCWVRRWKTAIVLRMEMYEIMSMVEDIPGDKDLKRCLQSGARNKVTLLLRRHPELGDGEELVVDLTYPKHMNSDIGGLSMHLGFELTPVDHKLVCSLVAACDTVATDNVVH